MIPLNKVPYDTFWHQNKEILNFGGTNYLGISGHQRFKEYLIEGIEKTGFSWGSSPVSPLQIAVYEQFEDILAKHQKAETATLVSSGMWAGQLVCQVLAKVYSNFTNIYAPYVHPALWGQDYHSQFNTFTNFEENIIKTISKSSGKGVNIFMDAVSTPLVRQINFDWLKQLDKTNKIINLIVDESHAVGVLGEQGEGRINEYIKYSNINIIRIASLNKAFGLPGGVILANKVLKQEILNNSMYIGASRMSPAVAYAGILAQDLYQTQRVKLQQNIQYFKETFPQIFVKLKTIPNHSAMEVPCTIHEDYMLQNGLYMPIFSYPTSTDMPIARVVICAYHNQEHMALLGNFLGKII